MQYKMLTDVLDVALAIKPAWQLSITNNVVDSLMDELVERQKHGELTAKQKRVLNCLCTVQQGEALRLERSKRIKQVNPCSRNNYPMPPI